MSFFSKKILLTVALTFFYLMSAGSVHAQAQGSFQGGSWLDAYVQLQQTVTPIGGSSFQMGGQFGNANGYGGVQNNINPIVSGQTNLNSADMVQQQDFSTGTTNNVANPNQFSTQSTNTITTTVPNNSGACSTNFVTVLDILLFLKCVITVSIIPLLFAIAISVFIFGVIKYIRNAEDSKKREEGRNFMIYGIVSIFVIVSMWGLVGFLRNTFFPNSAGQIFIPAPRTQSPQ